MNLAETDSSTIRLLPPSSEHSLCPPVLLSVDVEEGEAVEWIWTHFADGNSAVTGYRIVPQLPALLRGVNP
jgi:hypothetical protein